MVIRNTNQRLADSGVGGPKTKRALFFSQLSASYSLYFGFLLSDNYKGLNRMGDKKKKATVFIRLVSAAGTGFFYVKRKPTKVTEKLEFRKFDPRVNRHVLFTEAKMK